jgi:hypothetical protein
MLMKNNYNDIPFQRRKKGTSNEELAASLADKATKTELANIGNGSPKGTYASLSALQTAFPTGTTGIYIVTADGNWYYWNGSAWISGGLYQSTGLAEFPATNIVTNGNFANGTPGWTAQYGTGAIVNGNEYEYTVTSLNSSARIQQTIPATTAGHIYYVFGYAKLLYQSSFYYRIGGTSVFFNNSDILVNNYKRYSCLITAASATTVVEYHVQTNTNYAISDKVYFKYLGAIDLTTTFGVGKEPSISDMDTIMSNFSNSWFDGTNGQLIKFKSLYDDVKSVKSNVSVNTSDISSIKTSLAELPASNLVTNGNFSNGTTGWTAQYGTGAIVNGNEYEYTVTSLNSSARIQQTIATTTAGSIYYVFGYAKLKYQSGFYYRIGSTSVFINNSDILVNNYKRYSCLITATSASSVVEYHVQTDSNYVINDKVYFKYLGAIDLTATFGAGKEPSLSDMDSMMSKFTNSWFDGIYKQVVNFKEVYGSVSSNTTKLSGMVSVSAVKGEVVRPTKIPCVVGKKLNIHFANLLLNQKVESVSSINARNILSFRDFALIAPTDLNQISVTIRAYFGTETLVGNGTTTIIPVDSNVGSGVTKKCLFIGDSITDNGYYTNELLNLFNSDPMKIELIGTRTSNGNPLNKHEGRAGWSARDYINQSTFKSVNNAFWNPSTSSFDFSYYMTTNGFSGVDYVFINLGTNDTLSSNDYTNYSTIIGYYNTMINSMKAYNPNIKVFVGMTILQSTLRTNTYEQRNVVLNFIKALKTEYEPREGEGIYLVPNYINVDPQRDFNIVQVPLNDRTTETVNDTSDVTHPALSGYYKMSDVFYNYLKYVVSLG